MLSTLGSVIAGKILCSSPYGERRTIFQTLFETENKCCSKQVQEFTSQDIYTLNMTYFLEFSLDI